MVLAIDSGVLLVACKGDIRHSLAFYVIVLFFVLTVAFMPMMSRIRDESDMVYSGVGSGTNFSFNSSDTSDVSAWGADSWLKQYLGFGTGYWFVDNLFVVILGVLISYVVVTVFAGVGG